MARTYSALYRAPKPDEDGYIRPRLEGQWSVIYKDADDECFYVELEDAQDQETALRIAEGLNLRQERHDRPDIG